jgi:hypothetical protein
LDVEERAGNNVDIFKMPIDELSLLAAEAFAWSFSTGHFTLLLLLNGAT